MSLFYPKYTLIKILNNPAGEIEVEMINAAIVKFVLICGVFVNINCITALEPNKTGCYVYAYGSTSSTYSGLWKYDDDRKCEDILKEIQK